MSSVTRISTAARLPFLSVDRRHGLNDVLRSIVGRKVMPHELSVNIGLDYDEGLAVLAVLESEGASRNLLLIYHECEPDVVAGTIPYGFGWPVLPWSCPLCAQEIESYDELGFDVMGEILADVEFV